MEKVRNFKVDVIKVIGLFGVILAHVGCTNKYIYQLRNFDVPLLVFLSGYLSFNSYSKCTSYFKYMLKRIKRLLIPTWLFLIIYFSILLFNEHVFNLNFPYSLDQIKNSFNLLGGIGYVWIVRVYLLSALTVPLFTKLINNVNIKKVYILVLILLILNEYFGMSGFYEINNFVKNYIAYLIPYGIVTLCGLLVHKTDKDNIINLSLLFLIIYLLISMFYYKNTGGLVLTNTKKYPPMIYYLSYALFFSYLLISSDIYDAIKGKLRNIIIFISKSSFWIYLWHIYFIYLAGRLFPSISWKYRFILIVTSAVFITYIQNIILNILEKNNISKTTKKFLNIFRG